MATTPADIGLLVDLAYRIREDTPGCKVWDRQGIHVIFSRELRNMHLLTAVELVIAHASDPEAKTPAAINRPFKPDTANAPKPLTPKCPQHRDELAPPYCRIHATEEIQAYHDGPVERIPQQTARELARSAASAAADTTRRRTR